MTAGDSLIENIGEGIESSDKLIISLSPVSDESEWVKKEVSSGMIMEIAQEKRLLPKFIIPALLRICKLGFFLNWWIN